VSRLLRLRNGRGDGASLEGRGENNKPVMSPADIAALVAWVEAAPEENWRTHHRQMNEKHRVDVCAVTLRRYSALTEGKPKRVMQ
jgi:hypothetical protein